MRNRLFLFTPGCALFFAWSSQAQAQTTFVSDTFTGTNGTHLSAHNPDTGDASSWVKVSGTGDLDISVNQIDNSGDADLVIYKNTTAPTGGTAAYVVGVTGRWDGASASNIVGVIARLSGASNDRYQVQVNSGASTGNILLQKVVSGTTTTLATGDASITAMSTHRIVLSVKDATKSVTFDGTEKASSSDNAVTAAGVSGLIQEGLTSGDAGSDGFFASTFAATATRLTSFTATGAARGISLQWQTGYELDNLGFHLYREENGQRIQITPSLIAGSALFAGTHTTLTAGKSYSWFDEEPAPGQARQYWLEEVSLQGNSLFHPPVSPVPGRQPPLFNQRAVLLAGLGQGSPKWRGQERRAPWRGPASPTALLAAAVPTLPWVKLQIAEEGWYHVSGEALRAAGLSADPGTLHLLAEGQEQALVVSGDGIEFYGIGADTPWTSERAYILSQGGTPKRIVQVDAKTGGAPVADSFSFTIERRDRSVYFAALKNGEADNFFGPTVSVKPVNMVLPVQGLVVSPTGGRQSLEVELQGVTDRPHRVEARIRGSSLGEIVFGGQGRGILTADVPAGLLSEGDNMLTLVPSGEPEDVSLVDTVRLTYPRKYEATNDVLRFSVAPAHAAVVRGFSGADILAFDVTDAGTPVQLVGTVAHDESGYSLTLTLPNGSASVLALRSARVHGPASILGRPAGGLEVQPADLVILSPRAFMNALGPLVQRRTDEGLQVQLVDVEDAYDAFSFGQRSPYALRSFLEAARTAGGARYALLVGDASFDPRNFLGLGAFDFMPTKIVETSFLETASDDWLADFDGDLVPDLAIGRIPARTPEQAASVVEKLVAYDPTGAPDSSLLVVSGKKGDTEFAGSVDQILSTWPAGAIPRHVAVDVLGTDEARNELFAFLRNQGGVVGYLGHGSVEVWADGLLERADAFALESTRPSVFVALTCLNGFFHDVFSESLAEVLLKTPHGGALAVWASSGLTFPSEQVAMGESFMRAVSGGSSTLGDAALAAKSSATDDVRRTWILFGDPTLRLAARNPSPGTRMATNDSGGCGCRMSHRRSTMPALALGMLAGLRARRRRKGSRP